jgi:UDP-glucose:glycoprotein glucosyltransferase
MRPFKYSMEYGVKDTAGESTTLLAEIGNVTDETVTRPPIGILDAVNITSVRNFGARFATFASRRVSRNHSLLSLLRDVTHNFPVFLPAIAREREDLPGFGLAASLARSGHYSVLNGRLLTSTLDIFTLLSIVQEERTLTEILGSHHRVRPEELERLLTTSLPAEANFLLNWTSPSVVWFNDLERDAEYANWSDSVRALFEVRGQLPQVRKNLVDVVLHCDPSTRAGLGLLTWIVQRVGAMPFRFGMLPSFNLAAKQSRTVAYAFYHIAAAEPALAIEFLLGAVSEEQHEPTEEEFAASYTRAVAGRGLLPWGEIHTLLDSFSAEGTRVWDTHRTARQWQIPRSSVLVNGKLLEALEGMNGLLYEIQRMYHYLQVCVKQAHVTSLRDTDALAILGTAFMIVPSFDPAVLVERPVGLGLVHKSRAEQTEFLDFLASMSWNFTDSGRSSLYYILWLQKQEEIDIFSDFARENHSLPSVFALNPPISARMATVYGLDLTKTVLIADGRLFHSFTPMRLRLLDVWCADTIYAPCAKTLDKLTYKRSNAVFYVSSIVVDWRAEGITRALLHEELWAEYSPLVHNAKRDCMHWDLLIDPFTREFQRIADIVEYVNNHDVIDVRLIAKAPAVLAEPPQTYYRNALSRDRAVFTFLNDTTTYSAMPDMPDSWIFESMKAVIDLDNILLSELSPGVHEGTYVLTNVKAEGTCEVGDTSYAEGAELALVDARGTRMSDTIVMRSGYWQLAANPGQYTIELGGRNSKIIYESFQHPIVVASFAAQLFRLRTGSQLRWRSGRTSDKRSCQKLWN